MAVSNYETTILVRAGVARSDYEGTLAAVRATYESEGATFLELDKGEERKLAYLIDKEASAFYFSGYFTSDTSAIDKIERRALLGGTILRQLIVARPGKDLERIKVQRSKAVAAAIAAAAAAASEI